MFNLLNASFPRTDNLNVKNKKLSIKILEVIIKTVERCNLNCSYCYFFQGEDKTYKKNPAFVAESTIESIANFLLEGCKDLNIETLKIHFHGGEPMLQKIKNFDAMCSILHEKLAFHVSLEFSIQTNGTLITEDWINRFNKYNVGVGVSCDGPKEYHDQFRVDHKGNGSYEKLATNLKKLNSAAENGIIKPIGILCVVNPEHKSKIIYNHFTKNLGIKNINFLLPDFTHETFKQSPLTYGKYLCELFDAWVDDDNPEIDVRILKQTLQMLTGDALLLKSSSCIVSSYRILTISSKGSLAPEDTLRSANPNLMWSNATVENTKLSNFLQHPLYEQISEATQTLPNECQSCCWGNICRGGNLINRFSKEKLFANPSVFCHGLKQFYSRVTKYLLSQNFSYSELLNILEKKELQLE